MDLYHEEVLVPMSHHIPSIPTIGGKNPTLVFQYKIDRGRAKERGFQTRGWSGTPIGRDPHTHRLCDSPVPKFSLSSAPAQPRSWPNFLFPG